ncbi:MAG: gliding motility-associated C-terminal domain-containing protein [Alkalispirochaeta sp.]
MMTNNSRRIPLYLLLFLFAPLTVFAGGGQEEEAPSLDIPSQPRQFISPENQDGVQDVLELPFSTVVAPAEDMVITEYNLDVFDSDGRLVFLAREVEEERRGFFGNLFGGEKPQVQIPDSLTWDGTWNIDETDLPEGVSNGDFVEDGEYTYQLTVIDDAGNFSRSAPFAVTVDNTPPEVGDLAPPDYNVFSPNDDGVRDTIEIPLSGTREYRWTVEVIDESDEAVYTETYQNDEPRRRELDPAPPELFVWDGSTGSDEEPGEIAPEGEYSVRLTGTDRAGNSAVETHPTTIVLSLTAAELAVRSADDNPVFSPNGDGRRDLLPLTVTATDADSVRRWRIEVRNAGQVVRSVTGTGAPPERWEFDGRRDDGTVLDDGTVQVVVTADMVNGTTVASAPLDVTIDTVPPELSVVADTAPQETPSDRPLVFGAGDKERLTATITYERGIPWNYQVSFNGVPIFSGEISPEMVETVGVRPEPAGRPGMDRVRLSWRGEALDVAGEAADGLYELVVTGEDDGGNRLESRPYRVLKDTRTPEARLSLDGEHLSPLSDGSFSEVTFRTRYGAADIIEEFLFEIINEDDRMVRSEYKRQPFDQFDWNGLTNGGTVAPDGTYRGRLRVIYQNGHVTETRPVGPVRVDRTSPRITRLAAEPRRFSPDGDGEDDTVRIEQSVVPGDTWTGRIVDEDGNVVEERTYEDKVESFTWDGLDEDGEPLPDGDYRYILSSTDEAGNETTDDLLITLSTEPVELPAPEMRISLRPNPFSPDGDGVDDTITIGLSLQTETEITSWDAVIRDHTGKVFRTFDGDGRPPRSIRWNGLSDDGELVDSALDYPFEITLRDDQGNVVTEEATIATDILVIREGEDRLRIRISSIHFAGNRSDLFASDDEELNRNLDTLRRLARILNRYPDRQIIIEGHAAHIYLEDPAMQQEQDSVLIPLSRARAIEVMQALTILGVDRNRMTVEAYGGAFPVVPHADRENLWKNRRVEFLLHREGR